jgi:diguanylate cyclase (GGDEF)-like protein
MSPLGHAVDPARVRERWALVAELFPFAIALDGDDRVGELGRSIGRLCPGIAVGDPASAHLSLVSPRGELTARCLQALAGRPVILRTGSGVTLRTQVVVWPDEGLVAIFGSPWFSEPDALQTHGLTIADFAPHDPTPDFLFHAQFQSTALADTRRLAEHLQQTDAERRRLAAAEQVLARDLNALPDLVLRLDRGGTVLDFRGSNGGGHGDGASAVGCDVFDVVPQMRAQLPGALLRAFQSNDTQSFEYVGGEGERPEFYEARIVRCSESEALLLVRDVTENRTLQQQLAHQAFHDTLTGLANRARFRDRIDRAVVGHEAVAVLYLDLDDFKCVNDTLGHGAGDELLITVAERLRSGVRAGDLAARMGGDEFAVLVVGAEPDEVAELADRLVRALSTPIELDGRTVWVGASVGVVHASGEDCRVRTVSGEELLRSADVAMYWAKSAGKGRVATYERGMDERALDQLRREGELREALVSGDLAVHYQPIVSLGSARIVGVEALVRWTRPDGTSVPPSEFIPLAEQCGLIGEVGTFVLRTACDQLRRWDLEDSGHEPLGLSVNLSALQLVDDGVVELVASVLAESGLDPGRLTIEITETALLADTGRARTAADGLVGLGVHLALDDFGTGFSSLSHLRDFPIDSIKIDRMFIAGVATPGSDGAIAEALLQLGRVLKVGVVAEGVEMVEQANALLELGCPNAQGYFFARPMDARSLSEILAAGGFAESRR